jgi:ferredoxin
MKIHIRVDRTLCESNQVCVRACPEVFRIDESDRLVLLTQSPDSSLREKIARAVSGCPRQALSFTEDPS